MKILITGANGFVGKHLKNKIMNDGGHELFELNRNTPWSEIEAIISDIDLIYHLAGEVKPDSTNDEFSKSNVCLTEKIINTITSKGLSIPVIYASSIHAEKQTNYYGITKRKSEILLENYSLENDSRVIIFRLPHLFGEGCKVNYNSAITTWIFQFINGQEINIYDPLIEMNYVYIKDLIIDLIDKEILVEKKISYYKPSIIHEVKLGDVVKIISSFEKNKEFNNINTFEYKLFNVYKSFLLS